MPASTTTSTKRMEAGLAHYQRSYGDADRSSMICGGMSKMGKVIRPKMITGYSMLEGKKFLIDGCPEKEEKFIIKMRYGENI